MTSAFETAGIAMADGVRAQFGFVSTDVSALKNDVVRGYGAVKNASFDSAPSYERSVGYVILS